MGSSLNNIPCGYLEFNDQGMIVGANNRLSEMVSHSRKELIDNHIQSILTPGEKIFYQTHLFPLLKMEKQVDEIYLTLQAKDNKDISVLINARRSSKNNEAVNQCIIVRMERRSEYEDRILYDKKEAEKTSNKKEKLLSMMSHKLHSPLNVNSWDGRLTVRRIKC